MKGLTNFLKIPRGSLVFIDSSIFTYFLLRDSVYFNTTGQFLKKVESGDIIGFINNIVISEVLFNYVKAQICRDYHIKPQGFIQFVKRKPESIGDVDISEVEDIFSINNLNLIETPLNDFSLLRKAHKKLLLSNDAFHLLTMEYLNIDNIATNDGDFERIEGITVWKP
ncbi:MAG: PIN domain-containing protein [Candidatus Methanoperedens sp.]|nr:PIN domain-containing protein [Candidatus Methanoperedens sp.]